MKSFKKLLEENTKINLKNQSHNIDDDELKIFKKLKLKYKNNILSGEKENIIKYFASYNDWSKEEIEDEFPNLAK